MPKSVFESTLGDSHGKIEHHHFEKAPEIKELKKSAC